MRYNTKINELQNNWTLVKNHCRTTVNKEFTENEPSHEFKEKLLISEHSPIRKLNVDWTHFDIEYWASTELSRHKFEKYISTQRTDRTGIDRNKKPQGAPVKFDGDANAQNLIDTARKRLCYGQPTLEARTAISELKVAIFRAGEEELSNVMVPNCVYRCGCPEFTNCGYFRRLIEKYPDIDITNIKERYKAYNNEFWKTINY